MNHEEIDDIVKKISRLMNALSEKDRLKVLRSFEDNIPISVFQAPLSGLEIITKYLREEEKKSFKEISRILNRKLTTIYTTYSNSKIKFPSQLDTADRSILIPVTIFQNRVYSVLESVVAYLKDKEDCSLKEISTHLNKKYNTVKTVYRRFHIKMQERMVMDKNSEW